MRKHLLNFCVAALMGTGLLHAQLTQSENYVYSKTHLSKPGDSIQKLPVESVTYIDGLGRPKQSIAIKASPTGKDLVSTVPYDGFGRQVDTWLPAPMASLSGGIQGGVQSAATTYYNDPNPFSHQVLESSPLDRIQQQIQLGSAWSAKPVTFDYNTNSDTEVYKFITSTTWSNSATLSVLKLAPATDTYSISNKYKANQLYKNVVVDEDGNTTTEFKNGEGQTILVRKNDGVNDVDTYYVYNEYNQLAFVIPPKAVAVTLPALFPIKTNPAISTVLADLCYQYRYDGRGRLVEKKLPGKDWEYMVYDKQDRLVLTQDGKLRTTTNNFGVRGWLFTKYDQWGRVVYTGFFPNTSTRSSMQTTLNNVTGFNNENRVASPSVTLQGMPLYYTNAAYPTVSMTLLSVNYYDKYPTGTPFPTQNKVFGEDILLDTYGSGAIATQSLAVATFVKNINDHQWTKNYSFYDKKGRSIASHSINHLGGSTVQHSRLDFSGMVRKTKTYHKRLSTELATVIEETFEYDSQNRLAKHSHEVIGKSPKELLAENTYNETGTLKNKKVGGSGTPLQTVDYQYNIRGWMTGINDPSLLGNDLFGYKINYNNNILDGLSNPHSDVATPITGRYNGNIAEVSWKSINDPGIKRYGYVYDKLNRLMAGLYQNPNNQSSREHSEILTYDLNGNIATLKRTASTVGTTADLIDNLKYDYTGNRLDKVHDNQGFTANPSGYEGGGRTIGYDVNGNMTDMPDKGISAIQYNYLNLPTVMNAVDEVNTVNIGYVYRADGSKLRKTNTTTVTANTGISTVSVTDYLDGFQYLSTTTIGGGIAAGTGEFEVAMEREAFTAQSATAGTGNAVLHFVPTAEGFYDFKENKYIYQYKDHLGNSRLSYAWNTTTNSIDVLDKNDYYPFGMNHLNSNGGSHFGQSSFKNYKYNGKELQETGMYDYGARFYMPDIGRWGVVDPAAELGRRWSPYTYAFDNPVMFIDPDGMWPWPSLGQIKATYNDAKSQAHHKYQQAKAYTSQKYNEGKAYATQKYNEGKTYATQKYSEAKATAKAAKHAAANGVVEAASTAQNWVKENKTQLRNTAQAMQKTGDAATVTGVVMTAVGAPIAGVGSAPGIAVTAAGTVTSNAGATLEVIVDYVSGDLTAQKGVNTISEQVIGRGVDIIIDAIVPGSTPNMSAPSTNAAHELNQAASQMLKQTTSTVLKPEEL